jgi:hypothetical protein
MLNKYKIRLLPFSSPCQSGQAGTGEGFFFVSSIYEKHPLPIGISLTKSSLVQAKGKLKKEIKLLKYN